LNELFPQGAPIAIATDRHHHGLQLGEDQLLQRLPIGPLPLINLEIDGVIPGRPRRGQTGTVTPGGGRA